MLNQIGKPRVLEVMKDIRVTFPDMLGTIGKYILYFVSTFLTTHILLSGGTIGLFTGLSLLSVVEIVYWIYKTARALYKNK